MSKLPERVLCLVTDIERAGGQANLLEIIDQAVSGGVNMVQVRAHELDNGDLQALASGIVEVVNKRAIVVLNGSLEVALKTEVDGVHFQENTTLKHGSADRGLLIGKSVHSLESAINAEANGADYVVLGTIFPSASHPGGPAGGIGLVSSVTDQVNIPVIAIGGITTANSHEVISAGANGVAVIGAIIGSNNPGKSAKELAESIGLY